MDFLKDFEKQVSKMDGVTGSSEPPRYWHSFGNHVFNYIMSGDFRRGVPQGRLTGLAGPSGAGKSYIAGSLCKQAQQDDAFVFVIDSENAMDDDFMTKIGVDVDNNYMYKSVTNIPQVSALISKFLVGYRKEYGNSSDAQRVLIVIDSLDMLMTETEEDNYSKGKTKGDQGQRNKQLKAMLRTFVQDVKDLNVSIVVTSQVYKNQDLLNGEGLWIVSDAVRYSLSQIVLVTKKKLKGEEAGTFDGVQMNCQGFKTRFTKPFQKAEVLVPYDTGMNPHSGLMDAAERAGVVKRGGAWYTIDGTDDKRQSKNFDDEWFNKILDRLEALNDLVLDTDGEDASDQIDESAKASRQKKAQADNEEGTE